MTGATASVPTGNTEDKYGTTNPINRRLVAGFFDALHASVPRSLPDRVLEVGVGEGEVAARLRPHWPDATVVGLDLADEELAAHWPDKPFHPMFADVGRLPFPDRSFDLVMAIEVLEHVPDPDLALQELRRVARRDLILSVPREPIWRAANLARGKYVGALGNTPGHINHWGKRSFTDLVSQHVEVTSVRSPFPWTVVAATVRTR